MSWLDKLFKKEETPEPYDETDSLAVLLDSVESDYLWGKIDRETYLALLDQIDEIMDRREHGKSSQSV